ncbi:hypothetical protein [Fusobacterium sp. PH5-44]|uniref:hypothetical protein n=1 Tax=unclassified Fusobacterium TaxID=2648384 RepID=UPI003D19D5C6
MKTATLVPQVAKGIGQGVNNKELGQNVLGQLANNLGKNGFNIVAYAKGVEKELRDLISNSLDGKGKLDLDEFTMEQITDVLQPLLAEYGKEFYSIQFVEDEKIKSGMSIDDKTGTVYINLYGNGFGDAGSMLEQLGHEGKHGTYANHDVDETAVALLTKYENIKKGGLGYNIKTEVAAGQIIVSTKSYKEARDRGDLRDDAGILTVGVPVAIMLFYEIYSTTDAGKETNKNMALAMEKSFTYVKDGVLHIINNANGKKLLVDVATGTIIGFSLLTLEEKEMFKLPPTSVLSQEEKGPTILSFPLNDKSGENIFKLPPTSFLPQKERGTSYSFFSIISWR